MKPQLKLSNCLIEAIKLKLQYPDGKIGCDNNSPSGGVSFYFDIGNQRFRFRRKIRRYGNKSVVLFKGYRVVEYIK